MQQDNYRMPLIIEVANYKIRTFRILGKIQICLGFICEILSIAGIIIDSINLTTTCNDPERYYDGYTYNTCRFIVDAEPLLALDFGSLFFSGWFILTGMLPFCMTENRQNSWRCLKNSFMVLCIVGSIIVIPAAVSTSVIAAMMRADDNGGLAALPGFIALLTLAELAVAITSASFCCCCPIWTTTNGTGVVIANRNYTTDERITPTVPAYNYGTHPGCFDNEQQHNLNKSEIDTPPPYKV